MGSVSLTRRAAVTVLAGAALPRMSFAQREAVRWSHGTEKARAAAPRGAIDSHFHTYDRRYPAIPGSTLLPEDASPDDYRALQRRLGTSRGVLITPSTYGTDNSLQLASRQALGPENFRVVAVVAEDVPDAELRRLHEQGVRGVRFNLTFPGVLTVASLKPLAPRLAELGWTCQVNMSNKQMEDNADMLAALPGRLVFDHYARIPASEGLDSTTFKIVRRLLDGGKTWVKLCAPYLISKEGPPDSGRIAAALANAAPERLIWGSDWPHPSEPNDHKPDDAVLFDLLAGWVGDAASFKRILVDNPQALYGFPAVTP